MCIKYLDTPIIFKILNKIDLDNGFFINTVYLFVLYIRYLNLYKSICINNIIIDKSIFVKDFFQSKYNSIKSIKNND